MPAFLYGALSWFATNLLAKVLVGAGLGIFTYSIVSDFTEDLLNKVVLQFQSSVASEIVQILSIFGFIEVLNSIFAAVTIVGYFMSIKLVLGRS